MKLCNDIRGSYLSSKIVVSIIQKDLPVMVENYGNVRSTTTPLQLMNGVEDSHLTLEVSNPIFLVASKKGGEVQGPSKQYKSQVVSKVVEKTGDS
jgi:hypothetical protein